MPRKLAPSSLLGPALLACALVACAVGTSEPPATADEEAAPDASSPQISSGPVDEDEDDAATDAGADASIDAAVVYPWGAGGDFRAYADAAARALLTYYEDGSGLFRTAGWWQSANSVTALIDHGQATQSAAFTARMSSTFEKNKGAGYLNEYYDDEGWWALAWIRAYDVTKDAKYLAMAKSIFADMAGGWDSVCGGGIWWKKDKKYKNAIANELFLAVAAALHHKTPGDKGPGSYLEWAERTWSWFDKSTMINGQGLINDGLFADCRNNGQTPWTYNQGVILGALVDLSAAKGDPSLLARAETLAAASTTKLVDDRGVLHETCEADGCGADGPQFKGIYMRSLGKLEAALGTGRFRAFLAHNADHLWNAGRGPSDALGLTWSGPFSGGDAVRQTSGLDALVAAIPQAFDAPDRALGRAAQSSGGCAAGEGPEKAFDGDVRTKWCSGMAQGTATLTVDLGAARDVGRVILRHASAGGESAGLNTRACTLATSVDGTTFRDVASLRGNTRPVTIHSFASVKARYLRVTVTEPQTSAADVAARLYAVEAYER